MTPPPRAAGEFFQNFLPAWFAASDAKQATSPGALVFHIGDESYALRVSDSKLQVTGAPTTDAILQVSMSAADFAELVHQAEALFSQAANDRLLALRALSLDAERAKLIRNVDGSVAFEIADETQLRTLLLSPGVAVAGGSPPACIVRIGAADFWALSRGESNPFELLMEGKIRLQGRMDVAMALSSVLVG